MDDKELRKKYLQAKIGDLTAYAGMIGSEFSSKLDRLSQIIGTSHELSVGEYKESLLKGCLRSFLPKRYSVGTGFIVFVEDTHQLRGIDPKNADFCNLKSHSTSHQLDIVVYDDTDYAPLFKDGDFVVLRPESVRTIIEVKGFLSDSNVKECTEKFAAFARLWKQYSKRYDSYQRIFEKETTLHEPGLFLMGWNVAVDNKGKPRCTGKSLRRKLVAAYRNVFTSAELQDEKLAKINGAYIYDDCIVSLVYYATEDDGGKGYMTTRGKFVRYDGDGTPFLDRDNTIWNLLSSIHIHLDSPFNPDYAYFDQSNSLTLLPHEHYGTTDLVTGKEIDD